MNSIDLIDNWFQLEIKDLREILQKCNLVNTDASDIDQLKGKLEKFYLFKVRDLINEKFFFKRSENKV